MFDLIWFTADLEIIESSYLGMLTECLGDWIVLLLYELTMDTIKTANHSLKK